MAILIESKNIYSIENPKIRDNVIDNVKVEQTIIKGKTLYDERVFSENKVVEILGDSTMYDPYGDEDRNITINVLQKDLWSFFSIAFCAYDSYSKSKNIKVKIPKVQNNSRVNNVYTGLDLNGKSRIRYSLVCDIYKDDDRLLYAHYNTKKGTARISYNEFHGSSNIETMAYFTTEQINQESNLSYTNDYEYFNDENKPAILSTTATAKFPNHLFTITSAKTTDIIEDNIEYFELTFNIAAQWYSYHFGYGGEAAYTYTEDNVNLQGYVLGYKAKQIMIDIYGDTIGIDLTDGSITYGNGSKPSSLSGNELMQDSATMHNEPLTQALATGVLYGYENGKESAILLCEIGKYYNYDTTKPNNRGSIVIDTKDAYKPMTFDIGDEVVPMIMGSNGKDEPMSKKQDGTAKEFVVVGKRPFYDGAVWQELTLQEK